MYIRYVLPSHLHCSKWPKSLKKITINEFKVSGIGFVFGIWNKALSESMINTVFSDFASYIRLSYKQLSVNSPTIIILFLCLFTNCSNYL